MTIASPLAALLLLPVAVCAVLLRQRLVGAVSPLPGGWSAVVGKPLQRYLMRGLPKAGAGQAMLALAAAVAIVVAIMRPLLETGTVPHYANFAGEVVVVDAGLSEIGAARLATGALLDAAPELPVALVAVAGDAYRVVPLTTDRRAAERYLDALDPALMPVGGRALHLGFAEAERTLSAAGVAERLVVLVTSGTPPRETPPIPAAAARRTIAVPGDEVAAWQDYAETYGASVVDVDMIAAQAEGLRVAARRRAAAELTEGRIDVGPILVALAMLLWLGLFRRRLAT